MGPTWNKPVLDPLAVFHLDNRLYHRGVLQRGFCLTNFNDFFFSIVEDGIMVQVSQERMLQIRKSLNNMEDCRIDCGPFGAEKPDETVYIKWIENDQSVNAGWVFYREKQWTRVVSNVTFCILFVSFSYSGTYHFYFVFYWRHRFLLLLKILKTKRIH